ncbi:MAG: 5'-3' exonuclease H3TH domain-containing protein [bacterium]
MKKQEKLLLIDGNAILHRAYHALPALTDKRGRLVNAVYGFASILLKAFREIKPKYIAAAFDLAGPTFRHKLFKEYKAKRVKAPQELYDQLPIIKKLLKAFNIPAFEKQGYEADDIIGTISYQPIKTIILTGDLDTLQLVDKNTQILTGLKDMTFYDIKKIKERYDLTPKQIIDFKALKGDASDNIPGVPGIGEKTAIELLKKYKTLKNIYNNLDAIKQSTRKKLEDFYEQALFSKKLATIIRNVPIKFDLDKCLALGYNKNKVINFFKELGFTSLIQRLERG